MGRLLALVSLGVGPTGQLTGHVAETSHDVLLAHRPDQLGRGRCPDLARPISVRPVVGIVPAEQFQCFAAVTHGRSPVAGR